VLDAFKYNSCMFLHKGFERNTRELQVLRVNFPLWLPLIFMAKGFTCSKSPG